jgi:DNA topoisomerase I
VIVKHNRKNFPHWPKSVKLHWRFEVEDKNVAEAIESAEKINAIGGKFDVDDLVERAGLQKPKDGGNVNSGVAQPQPGMPGEPPMNPPLGFGKLKKSRPARLKEQSGGGDNCGTGDGGFKPGNTCAGEGGSGGARSLSGTNRTKDGELRMADGSSLPDHIPKNIPPAWTDVEVNPDPNGALLVKGRDAKGRVQSVYSEAHSQKQAAKKFARTKELLENRDKISSQISAGMKSSDPDTRESASALFLISETGLRPGSDRDTKADKKAFGATNLEARHVSVGGDGNVSLKFTGKKGVDLDIPVSNSGVAKMLLDRKNSAKSGTSRLFNTDDQKLRDFAKTVGGGKFKPKDFRTAVGTSTAVSLIAKNPEKSGTMKDYKARVKDVAKAVSQKLGNTPTVALQSYIDPTVFSGWRPSDE